MKLFNHRDTEIVLEIYQSPGNFYFKKVPAGASLDVPDGEIADAAVRDCGMKTEPKPVEAEEPKADKSPAKEDQKPKADK